MNDTAHIELMKSHTGIFIIMPDHEINKIQDMMDQCAIPINVDQCEIKSLTLIN